MTVDLHTREIQPLRQTFDHVARYVGNKPASRYEEATLGAQPSANFHYRPTWDPEYELFDPRRSALVFRDWYVLRDPRQFYYGTWTMARARQQEAMEANFQFVETRRLGDKLSDAQREMALRLLLPLRHAVWGGNMNNCAIAAYGYGTALTAAATFHAMDQLGVAQYLTRCALALDEPACLDQGKSAWLDDPLWQPLRQLVEDSLVLRDPMELFVAQNLAIDGLLYPLVFEQFVDETLASQGATAIGMMTAFMPEWHAETARWVDAVLKASVAESEHNRDTVARWVTHWTQRAFAAFTPWALTAFGEHGQETLDAVHSALLARTHKFGLALSA